MIFFLHVLDFSVQQCKFTCYSLDLVPCLCEISDDSLYLMAAGPPPISSSAGF